MDCLFFSSVVVVMSRNVLLSADADVAGVDDIPAFGRGCDDTPDCSTDTETSRHSHGTHNSHAIVVSMLCAYPAN